MITLRVPAAVLALVICMSTIGYAVFPHPPHRNSGVTIKLPHRNPANDASAFAGVARGDVRRVVLVNGSDRQTLYTRGNSWGEFDSASATSSGARLLVYGHGRLLETVRLDVPVGQQRVLR